MLVVLASGGFVVLALAALVLAGTQTSGIGGDGGAIWLTPRITYVVWSAAVQATLSAFAALLVALPASIVLARNARLRSLAGLRFFIALAMVVPTTVAASGILIIWGRAGIVNQAIAFINSQVSLFALPPLPSIYGLEGVVLAHVFFNAPLMVRVFVPQILSVAENHWRVARSLGMHSWGQARFIEWVAIRSLIVPMLVLVFLLCFSSFALVLMLGGGPRVTTLEVEIYSAIRIEFDFAKAVLLTWLQLLVAGGVVMLALPFRGLEVWGGRHSYNDNGNDFRLIASMQNASPYIKPPMSWWMRVGEASIILLLIILVVLPLLAIIVRGGNLGLIHVLANPLVRQASIASISIAVTAATIVMLLAMVLAETRMQWQAQAKRGLLASLDASVMVYLVVPSIVMGTALFILLRGIADMFALAPLLVLTANVMLGLPFGYRLLAGKWAMVRRRTARLEYLYAIPRLVALRYLILPLVGRECGFIFGLIAALSMGDLGVIALFANPDFQTLPWVVLQQAGRYRLDEAANTALLLMLMTVVMFVLGDVLGRYLARPPSILPKPVVKHAMRRKSHA